MLPTLQPNDRVLVLQRARPRRFDIVVFTDPTDGNLSIKRVVGLPGDLLELRAKVIGTEDGLPLVNGHALRLNDRPVGEAYASAMLPTPRGPLKVPAGRYYLLGDNRDNSLDSRDYGPVKAAAVRGRAVAVYYPFARFKRIRPTAKR